MTRVAYDLRWKELSYGPKPVEAGKEYYLQITEISRKGDGISRLQGFIIFVKLLVRHQADQRRAKKSFCLVRGVLQLIFIILVIDRF